MTTRSAPQQAERRPRRALLAAGRAGDGRAKFAPPSPSGRSRRVLPIPRHRATRGFVRRDTEPGGGNLPEPCHLDFRAWRVVNGAENLAAPFSPSLPVTVGENFPHRATRRCTPSAYGDGGATLAPPCRLRLLPASTGVQNVHPRSSRGLAPDNGGGKFPAPSPLLTVVANWPHRATWGFTDPCSLAVPPR